jgi:adenylate cyclase
MSVDALIAWLVDGALDAPSSEDVVLRVCEGLARGSVPIDRVETFVRTLHPHIVGRTFTWRLGKPIAVSDRSYEYLQSPEFLSGPVAHTFRTGQYVRIRLADLPASSGAGPLTRGEHPSVSTLREAGHTDFLVAPLRFRSGDVHAFTFATSVKGGFTEEHLAKIRSVVPPLARIGEILALSRVAVNLLSTYVGSEAGERILSGQIRRGDLESIAAVIWCSDLRGFTTMTSELPPGEVIRALNELFECQVAAIEKRGGEVLKFIGDGLLAIFRIGARFEREQCEAALAASSEAFESLAAINDRRAARGDRPLRVGLALHLGQVEYGNIGSPNRLDFTCIGPAVNLAARMEGVASKLGKDLVVSEEFRKHASGVAFEPLGSFELKGIAKAQTVYGLASPPY